MPPDIVGCPADIEVIIELGTTRAMVDWIEPFSNDESGTDRLISRSNAPGEQFIIGRTTVVYIFGDSSGNRATCSFGVIVTAGELNLISMLFKYMKVFYCCENRLIVGFRM